MGTKKRPCLNVILVNFSRVSIQSTRIQKYDARYTDMVWNMRWEGNDIIRKRVEKYHIDCDLKWGYLDVAIKKRHIQDLKFSYEDFEHVHIY